MPLNKETKPNQTHAYLFQKLHGPLSILYIGAPQASSYALFPAK